MIYECTEERFLDDVKNHKMTILKDDGLYRHLRFKRPDSSTYWFDIVTFPQSLVITGDMGDMMYQRLEDMFQFFRNSEKDRLGINLGYWAEKVVCGKDEISEFSQNELINVALRYIDDHLDGEGWTEDEIQHLKDDVSDEINCCDSNSVRMYDLIDDYKYYKEETPYWNEPDFIFTDWWECHEQAEVYTFHYVWRSYAIAWAVQQYDLYKENLNGK
jgi:hypothetical protein